MNRNSKTFSEFWRNIIFGEYRRNQEYRYEAYELGITNWPEQMRAQLDKVGGSEKFLEGKTYMQSTKREPFRESMQPKPKKIEYGYNSIPAYGYRE